MCGGARTCWPSTTTAMWRVTGRSSPTGEVGGPGPLLMRAGDLAGFLLRVADLGQDLDGVLAQARGGTPDLGRRLRPVLRASGHAQGPFGRVVGVLEESGGLQGGLVGDRLQG